MSAEQPEDATSPPRSTPARGPVTSRLVREITTGSAALTVLSVVLALVVGAVLIALSDPDFQAAAGYFFSRPSDTFVAAWESVSGAYTALFQGSVVNFQEYTVLRALRPLGDTLTQAAPLIAGGLGVALAFRVGLFNIGGEGQILMGALAAAWVGFGLDLPAGVHVLAAVAAAVLGSALWAGIPGVLKAWTGAHEVIVTIMLNYVARFLLAYLLTTTTFQRQGTSNPISPYIADSAVLPRLFGDATRLHLGFVLSLLAAVVAWWLLTRSTTGFEFRAVGANPNASRTAGMSVGRVTVTAMLCSGAFLGLAAASLVLGTERYLTDGISGGLGFDAITVALLGRGNPWGVAAAGVLFGAFRAGGVVMQASTGTSIDIVLVVQSMIVLFIAAPPLVRAILRVPVADEAGGAGASPIDDDTSKGWKA